MTAFRIDYQRDVLDEDLSAIPANMFERISRAIKSRLSTEPEKFGEPLRHPLRPVWKIRSGDYRVAYTVDRRKQCVTIWAIRQRRDVYRVLASRIEKRKKLL